MAFLNFAKLDENNIVTNIITVGEDVSTSNGLLKDNPKHIDGENYCKDLFGGNWKQYFLDGSYRKQAAAIDGKYDPINDVFILPQPYNSWNLNSSFDWEAPVTKPNINEYNDELIFSEWDEENKRWIGRIMSNDSSIYLWNVVTNSWEIL